MQGLPPTSGALEQHIRRAHLQAILWNAADDTEHPEINVSDYGWELDDNGDPHPCYGVKEVAPQELLKIVACSCSATKACSRSTCSCNRSSLTCTTYCKCAADCSVCNNPFLKLETTSIDEGEDSESEV